MEHTRPGFDTAGAWQALASKLQPPALVAGALPRHKLLAALDAVPDWRILVLLAPAGYGKSTLMSQLFSRLQGGAVRCGWLTLDARDDDLKHLLIHLQAALGVADGKQPQALDLGSWLNQVARLPGQQVLFLDEFESLQAIGAMDLLNRLLRFAPDNLCFVIGTRPESGLALGRLKASSQVLEWSVRQLRFDRQEAQAFLHSPAGGRVPAAWHDLLVERCEGWPAILRLSALALSQSEAPHRFLEVLQDASSGLADYLAGEIFDRQSAEHKDFLLRSSVLSTLTPALCDVLCERNDSAQVLHELSRRNEFVAPPEHLALGAYRQRPLLREFLRMRLEVLLPGLAPVLHRKAAEWLEHRGQLFDAVRHAMDAGEPQFAAAMLARAAKQLVKAGNLTSLLQWVRRLPPHIADNYPEIVWSAARAHTYSHQIEAAEARLSQLFGLARSRPLESQIWDDCLALEALIPAVTENVARVMAITERNLTRVSGDYALGIINNVRAYGQIAMNQFDATLDSLDRADRHNRKAVNLFGMAATVGLRAALWSTKGELHRALACYTGIDLESLPVDPFQLEYATAGSGLHAEILYEADRLDEARAILAIHAVAEDGNLAMGLLIGSYLTVARLRFLDSGLDGALKALAETLEMARTRRFQRLAFACRWEQVRLATLAGQLPLAATLAASAEQEAADAWFYFTTDTEARDIAGLRLQIRLGQARSALPRIEDLLLQARTLGRGWRALKLSILRACALDALGQALAAGEGLANAMIDGSRHGFVRSFADEGAPVLNRVAAWLAMRDGLPAGVPRAYAEHILRAGGIAIPVGASIGLGGDGGGIENFNPREREILRALAGGAQNRELATRFQISENTVKWYLKNLYAKLGARNRTQVIAHARQAGLID